jgi:hypothetical protein
MSYGVFARKESDAPAPASRSKTAPSAVSGGLRIGPPDDAYEQEAGCVADDITSGGAAKRHWSLPSPSAGTFLQRKCSCGTTGGSGGKCEECKQEKEGKLLQKKAAGPTESGVAPPIVHEVLNAPGQSLDTSTRAFMEPRFGHDFGQVRVHTDSKAAESARAVGALAYTVGRHVVFGTGQYVPETASGKKLLAHELTHTVQQRSSSGVEGKLAVGSPNDRLERLANQSASGVLSGKAFLTRHFSMPETVGPVVQRQPASAASAASEPSVLDESARLLGQFDMNERRGRAWKLDRLAKEIGKAFMASDRAYLHISGLYEAKKDPEQTEKARTDAWHRAEIVEKALQQWIDPTKFPPSRYYLSSDKGEPGGADFELRIRHRPRVVARDSGASHAPGPQPQPQRAKPPSPSPATKPDYGRPYPATRFDAFKAFLSTPQGEALRISMKNQLKSAWQLGSRTDLIVVLQSMLQTAGIISYGFFKALSSSQRSEIINLFITDRDPSLLRPLDQKALLIEGTFDPSFSPIELISPVNIKLR